jgi:AbrB family looped-hinge helix DNA binding protein
MSLKGNMPETQIRLKLAENGRVVIPAHVRRELGVESGGEIILEKKDDRYYLTTRRQRIEDARRQIRRYIKPGTNAVDELIAERREAAKHE